MTLPGVRAKGFLPVRTATGQPFARSMVLAVAIAFSCAIVLAQQSPAPPAPPAAAPVAPPAAPANPPVTDAPKPQADAAGGEMKEIVPQPVLRFRGQSPWDEAHVAIRKAIDRLEAEAKRLGLARQGNPMAHFIDSDDLGFTFEAMVPLAAAPEAGKTFAEGIDATLSPGGRSVIFPYEGANDEIDNAYEALTAWLDDKGLVSTGRYLEEYENLPERGDDPGMKAKIIIFLK